MSDCIEKLPHSCGTRNGLQVFKKGEGYDGWCFSCGTYVADPYQDKPKGYVPTVKVKTQEEIDQEFKEIGEYKCIDLPERKLLKPYLDYFGVKVAVSEQDGTTPHAYYFPYTKAGKLTSYKARLVSDKRRMWGVGSLKDVDFFGWKQAIDSGAKRLIITEGEFDAVALFQIIKEANKLNPSYAEHNPAVVSLPSGASNADKVVAKFLHKITKNFKEIVLAFDMDKPGKDAANKVCTILPSAMSAELPEKDANECLIKGRAKACRNAVMFNAEKQKNTRLVWGKDLHDEARQQARWGVSWPWKKLTELTRGIRKGETVYIGAGQKMGKSEVVNTIAGHLIKEHQWKVLLAKPEESNLKSYKLLAGKLVGKVFHDPKVEFDYKAYDESGKLLAGSVCMIDLYQHLGWETLKSDIISAASEGVDAVFIDPITNLTNGMSAADANTKLQEVAQELSAMAKDLNLAIFIFCHLRNPDSGAPHDRGGAVLTSQFAGSRAMGRSCHYTLGLEGNKDPTLTMEERNTRVLVILDDREFGETGKCSLYWDRNTGLFNEIGD